MTEMSLAEALDRCPCRSVVTLTGRLDPILGAWGIIQGPALPVPARVFKDATRAFQRRAAFLILPVDRADRDAAKAALLLRFGAAGGRA